MSSQNNPSTPPAAAPSEPVGYMMKHQTGLDVGFSWDKDDQRFGPMWVRIPLFATPPAQDAGTGEPTLDAVLACYSPDDTAADYQEKIRQLYAKGKHE